jgi:folylpolyglutamate synthase
LAFPSDLTAVTVSKDDLKTQQELAEAWTSLVPTFPKENVHVLLSIEHAVGVVREKATNGAPVEVFVTGSLHLVGGLIEVAGLSDVAL